LFVDFFWGKKNHWSELSVAKENFLQHWFLRKRILAWFINIENLSKNSTKLENFVDFKLRKKKSKKLFLVFFFLGEKITCHDLQLRNKIKN
jgi:hypothetical protein